MSAFLQGHGPAVLLALASAVCFAGSAVLQHRAVTRTPHDGHLGLVALLDVVRQRGWIGGVVLGGLAVLLHVGGLSLAPLRVVQPVGVLAVPIAVLFTTLRVRRRPPRGVVLGAGLAVAGVALFVGLSAGSAAGHPPRGAEMLTAALVVGCVVLLAALVGSGTRGRARCVAYATAAATSFGLVSALVRAMLQLVIGDRTDLIDLPMLTAAAVVVTIAAGGAWLVQQAYAAAAPSIVVASLTVVDPIVAVLLGAVLLGEGAHTPTPVVLVLTTAAAIAAAGVVTLARHHPEADARRSSGVPAEYPALKENLR